MRRRIRSDLNDVGVDPSALFDCLVAVTEACSNALIHGTEDDVQTPEVSWQIDDHLVCFLVQDFGGQEWSMASHPSRATSSDLDELQEGRYGLKLMRELMDEVDIDISADGTKVSLTKKWAQPLLPDQDLGSDPTQAGDVDRLSGGMA